MVLYLRKRESKEYDSFKTLGQLPLVYFTISVVNGYYYGEKFAELIKNPTRFSPRKMKIRLSYWYLKK
jgi:hypothetical protein